MFGFWNSRWEKRLNKKRCVRNQDGTNQGDYPHQKPHWFFMWYWILELKHLNWIPRSKLPYGTKKFQVLNSGREKWLKK
jgi:hypothetical protein